PSASQILRALDDPGATAGVALKVRCGVHAGMVERRDDDYYGSVVNRAARIASAAHGGQLLLSRAVVTSQVTGSRMGCRCATSARCGCAISPAPSASSNCCT